MRRVLVPLSALCINSVPLHFGGPGLGMFNRFQGCWQLTFGFRELGFRSVGSALAFEGFFVKGVHRRLSQRVHMYIYIYTLQLGCKGLGFGV